jgi:hypothetical protein
MGKSYIIIKTNRGGWYKSNQYLLNWNSFLIQNFFLHLLYTLWS